MGNCLVGGIIGSSSSSDVNEAVKVVTSNGGIMEFKSPTTVEAITNEFPGHAIFRSHDDDDDLFWKPLSNHEVLKAGESYYLLPLNTKKGINGHVRSNSEPQKLAVPYRMSFDCKGSSSSSSSSLKRSYTEAFCRSHSRRGGVWKVKLVISPEELLDILSQEAKTQEFIESVRTVAKCGNIGGSVAMAADFSHQWSLSSSRNASSKTDGIFEI